MLRRCFLLPTPEHDLAADLLSDAANALLCSDFVLCKQLIQQADLRSLRDFAHRIMGPIDPEIHRQSKSPIYLKIAKCERRMPSASVEHEAFKRDGYRCRYCGTRVIIKQAQQRFTKLLPEAARWGRTNESQHFGLATLRASVDHVIPFSRGGTNDLNNLITACNPCQFGKANWILEEIEIEDPRNYLPVVDDWDGLSRLVGISLAKQSSAVV